MLSSLIDTHYLDGKPKDHADFLVYVSKNIYDAHEKASENNNSILGVVGQAEFDKLTLKQLLDQSVGYSKIHVFRHEAPMLDDRWENGLNLVKKAGFDCELDVESDQYVKLEQISSRFSDMNFILSTTGVDRKNFDLKNLAKNSNVSLKILVSNIDYENSRAWILDSIELFGTERVMFGMGDKAHFTDISKMVSDFSTTEQENLFCNSAKKWYKLSA